jgi:hypothetical protein
MAESVVICGSKLFGLKFWQNWPNSTCMAGLVKVRVPNPVSHLTSREACAHPQPVRSESPREIRWDFPNPKKNMGIVHSKDEVT